MALRRLLLVAALALCASTGCSKDGSGDDGAKLQQTPTDLDKRCMQFAKVCGDKSTHVEKILAECKQAAKQQLETGCADKAIAVYDCYEKELCTGTDKVWTIDDIRVLSDRTKKCVAERTASRACAEPK